MRGVPVGEVQNNAREKTRFGQAQQKAHDIKLGFGLNEHHAARHNAPSHHDACYPNTGTYSVQNDIARHFKKEVANEKHARTQSIHSIREPQFACHLQLCKTDIDTVQISNDLAKQQQGDETPRHLEVGGFFKGGGGL